MFFCVSKPPRNALKRPRRYIYMCKDNNKNRELPKSKQISCYRATLGLYFQALTGWQREEVLRPFAHAASCIGYHCEKSLVESSLTRKFLY